MNLVKRFIRCTLKYLTLIAFRLNKVQVNSVKSANGFVRFYNQGKITIGSDFSFNSGRRFNPIGGDTIINMVCKAGASIIIGDNVGISNSTLYAEKEIKICDNVRIGGGCKLWDTDHHSIYSEERLCVPERKPDPSPVVIHKNVWICASVTVLPGVSIGEGSVVAAGSLVTKNVPRKELWGGNPAKKIRCI